MWPRMLSVLPKGYADIIEEKNNHLMFLLNSSFLVIGIAILSLMVGSIWFPCALAPGLQVCKFTASISESFLVGFSYVSPVTYVLIGICAIGFAYVLYRIGVNVAEEIGLYIRSSYDLYRMQLLKQLNWGLPESLEDEQHMWHAISTFIVAANRLDPSLPEYYYSDDLLQYETSIKEMVWERQKRKR